MPIHNTLTIIGGFIRRLDFWKTIPSMVAGIRENADDDDEKRLQKLILVITTVMISIAGIL